MHKPQKMSKLVSTVKTGLAKYAFFSTLPANILTIPLEMLADYTFSCPCDSENNTLLTGLVFSAPTLYILSVMLLFFHYVLSKDKKEVKKENEINKIINYWINFIICLFPPILWIIILMLDGDYMACSQTDWKGVYVLDDKLKIKWCKPTELIPGRNQNELQILTLSFINKSQVSHMYLEVI